MKNKRTMWRLSINLLLLLFITIACSGDGKKASSDNSEEFIRVENGQFRLKGESLYFIGTNFWYGPILGSQGKFGDRDRLVRELDFMKENGITNLRVLVGADGPDGVPSKVMPALQKSPGVYKRELLDGLDFFMNELAKRDMYAVLYLNNTWEWSGGYAQYLNWAGYGPVPIPSVAGWDAFSAYVADYFSCDSCVTLFKDHISEIISRTNFYNHRKYSEDPNIMSWQIANEPRPMGAHNKEAYVAWIKEIASHIKSLDTNHLVSTGSEGQAGSEEDFDLYARIHADTHIDYLTMHIWPKNWSWIHVEDISGSLENAMHATDEYINKHIALSQKLQKPITLEEFGFPRDNHQYVLADSTIYRDTYYQHIFERILQSSQENDVFAGCNFWAWGGYARPADDHLFWQIGDDYMGDPAQEEQGLNSVFDTDHTITVIRQYASQLNR
ncbi:MAG: cellulase family glycosylhydrolase [Tannerellaceae bacterium]|nr:cellulase family glycosylhydrolase [Tannerellaceae bacterium]